MRYLTSLLGAACLSSALFACSGGDSTADNGGGGGTLALGAAGKGGAAGAAGKGNAGASGKAGGASGGAGAAGGSAAGKGGAAGTGGAAGAAGAAGGSAAGKGGQGGGAGKGGAGAGGGAAGGAPGGAAGQAGQGGSGPVDHGPVTGITIDPSVAQIDVVDGASSPVSFKALKVYKDGFIGAAADGVTWAIDQADLATITAAGVVAATGTRAGDAQITATSQGMSATAQINVTLKASSGAGDLPPGAKAALDGASQPDGSAVLSYPYDNTVFPRGLLPPQLMWSNTAAGEPMKLSLVSDYATIELYFLASPDGRFSPPADAWQQITESGDGGTVSMKLAHVGADGAGKLIASQTWRLASGSLRGTVYYWSNNKGRILRIKPGASAPDDFLANANVNGCSTCHAVSANGNTLVIGGDVDTSTYDLVNNQSVFSVTSVGKPIRNWAMPAVSPNGNFLVENNAALPGPPGGSDGFWNTANGQKITGTGLDGKLLDMPSFAADGSRIVFVNHDSKALSMVPYSEAGGVPQAGGEVQLVPFSGDPNNQAFAFPTVAPSGKWAVYARSNLDTRSGPGDLFLASAEGPGGEIALDALNGANYAFVAGDRDRHFNYEPTFMPVAAGGYFWVVFTSRRTYGNQLVDAPSATKQLWVAAIDIDPQPGQDPSHPPILVPGQDLTDLNMRGFWALDPCREDGQSCSGASQCCSKVCLPDGTCGGSQSASCKSVGDTCATAADCCFANKGYQCINNHCTEAKP
jgi:hypothetical protein